MCLEIKRVNKMSESEVCQLAYEGNVDIFKFKVKENPDLARRPDQVWFSYVNIIHYKTVC